MIEQPPIGTPLQIGIGRERWPVAEMARQDPEQASAEILAAYLRCAVFLVPGNPDQRFRLNEVLTEWPSDFSKLNQPAASLTRQVTLYQAHSLTPTALEETADCYGAGTLLWKLNELSVDFQVDFWLTNKAERSAILAALPGLFNPSEARAGVILQGSPLYYDRTLRCTLKDHQRVDSSNAVFTQDRELRVGVLGDIDVVELRRYVRLEPRIFIDGEPASGPDADR